MPHLADPFRAADEALKLIPNCIKAAKALGYKPEEATKHANAVVQTMTGVDVLKAFVEAAAKPERTHYPDPSPDLGIPENLGGRYWEVVELAYHFRTSVGRIQLILNLLGLQTPLLESPDQRAKWMTDRVREADDYHWMLLPPAHDIAVWMHNNSGLPWTRGHRRILWHESLLPKIESGLKEHFGAAPLALA